MKKLINNLKIGSNILLQKEKYSIIDIDYYSLINLYQKEKSWVSFTIANNPKQASFSFIENQFIFWQQEDFLPKDINKIQENFPLNCHLSGIAPIQLEGDKGISKPWAELIWFQDKTFKDIFC